MTIVNFIPKYEALTGEKVSLAVACVAEQLDIVGKQLEAKGCEDVAKGLPVPPGDVFQAWGKKLFEDDPTMAETVADLAWLYYMDGYKNGGAT